MGLKFSTSDENSATLGVPVDRRRNSRIFRHTGDHVLARLDAWDGFDDSEKEGSAEVDHELSSKINLLNLPLACVEETPSNGKSQKKSATRSGHTCGVGRTNGGGVQQNLVVEAPLPLAMYPTYPSSSFLAGLGSEEMIPPFKGLSSFVFSA
jgi:hypothetical protein